MMTNSNHSIEQALHQAQQQLASHSTTAQLDSELLLTKVLAKQRSWLYANPNALLPNQQLQQFNHLIQLRCQGQPIAYLLGHKDFWRTKLIVNQHTLIPRPETELLVEQILQHLPADQPCRIVDLGTGSGAIAIALAMERCNWSIIATDISSQALQIAQLNSQQLQLNNIQLALGDWCEALKPNQLPAAQPAKQSAFDAIVSNPPYIASNDPCLQAGDLRFEPQQALQAGKDGLQYIRSIITQAKHHLKSGGWLWLEHGYQQAVTVKQLLQAQGYQACKTYADLAGHPRVTGAHL